MLNFSSQPGVTVVAAVVRLLATVAYGYEANGSILKKCALKFGQLYGVKPGAKKRKG